MAMAGEAVIVSKTFPTSRSPSSRRQPDGRFPSTPPRSKVRAVAHFPAVYRLRRRGLFDMEDRQGFSDMFSANGGVRAMAADLSSHLEGPTRFRTASANYCYGNLGKGKGFEKMTSRLHRARPWPASGSQPLPRLSAMSDNDGGADILVTNNNGSRTPVVEHGAKSRPLDTGSPGGRVPHQRGPDTEAWWSWWVQGLKHIRQTPGERRRQLSRRQRSQNSLRAWESRQDVDRIQVHWLAGACEAWHQTAVDRIVNLREGTGKPCH